jgi:type IV pilus assembly protein PilX
MNTLASQRGAALAVSLIILVILTIIGISAVSKNISQERMAGASMARNSVLQLADAARIDAEFWLNSLGTWISPSTPPSPPTPTQPGVWPRYSAETLIAAPVSRWTDINWTSAHFWNYGGQTAATLALLVAINPPRYLTVEWANPIDNEVETEKKNKGFGHFFYSQYAHGLGDTGAARATLLATQPKMFK